jgi:ribonucleoside-diphosphate reductase alpha chain
MTDKVKHAVTVTVPTGCGSMHVTINLSKQGRPYTSIQLGKNGGCAPSWADTCTELLTLALRSGESLETISKKLRGSRCPTPVVQDSVQYLSCGDALSKALMEFAGLPQFKHLTDAGMTDPGVAHKAEEKK